MTHGATPRSRLRRVAAHPIQFTGARDGSSVTPAKFCPATIFVAALALFLANISTHDCVLCILHPDYHDV